MAKLRDQALLDRIGEELRKLRESKNLSQEDVYNDTGIHIARIELGKINVTISTLSELCKYYRIRLPEFLSKSLD